MPDCPSGSESDRGDKKAIVLKEMEVRVTAYYGPRSGQRKYVLGSYKRMSG